MRDILQEVNIFLWENMDKFEVGTSFKAWASAVAYYKILDHRKKMKRNRFVVFDEELSKQLVEDMQNRAPAGLEAKRNALQSCLGKLSAENRTLLEARYRSTRGELEALSAEIGRSRGSLRVTLVRLRSSLRQCIEAKLAMEGVKP